MYYKIKRNNLKGAHSRNKSKRYNLEQKIKILKILMENMEMKKLQV